MIMDYTKNNLISEAGDTSTGSASTFTLGEARRIVGTWVDLNLPTRANLRSVLLGAANIAGEDPEAVPLNCEFLNGVLYRKPPAALEMTPQAFGNLVSGVRRVMRRLKLHAEEPKGREGLSPAWQELYDRLPPYRRLTLVRFMAFCSQTGVEPHDVGADVLASFEAFCRTRLLCADPSGLARRTASAWNWAAANVPAWPQTRLNRPGMRDFYTRPLTEFPMSFQQDVDLFLARAMSNSLDNVVPLGTDPRLRHRKTRRVTSQRTLDTRRWQVRQLAAAYVLQGGNPEDLTSLRDLVEPHERALALVDFYFARAGHKPNGQVAGIVEVARQIARYHCRLPPEVVDTFSGWLANARPANDGMVEKNRERLLALIAPRRRAMLLALPGELMRRARAPGLTPKAAARLAAYAVALEILIVFPMRRANLAGLKVRGDTHLRRLEAGSKRITHIVLSTAETKNKVALHWPIPPETAALIAEYDKVHRPHIASPGNVYLFPGPGLAQRSAHELAIGLSKLIHETVGVEVNCHLMRHFGAWLFLQRNPGQYEVVRQVLGHRKLSTTVNFYAGLEADASARHYDQTVQRERAETRLIAKAAFTKGPFRRIAKGGK